MQTRGQTGGGGSKPESEVTLQLSRVEPQRRLCATLRKTDAATIFRQNAQLNSRRTAHACVKVRGRSRSFPPALVMKMIDLVLLSPFLKRACWDSRAGVPLHARASLDTLHMFELGLEVLPRQQVSKYHCANDNIYVLGSQRN